MAITITPSTTKPGYLEQVTYTIAGASASTDYVFSNVGPSFRTDIDFKTDGSGGATIKHAPVQNSVSGQTFTQSVRPKTEFVGTTTAAASNSHKGGGSGA